MPFKPSKPCGYPGCPNLAAADKKYCFEHRNVDERRRGTSTERGYNYRWSLFRVVYLKQHPLCVECQKGGRLTPATEIDHIIPHRGDQQLLWDESNMQSLCHRHHS